MLGVIMRTNKLFHLENRMRKANLKDIPVLIELMSEFYSESGYDLDKTQGTKAFSSVLDDERNGFIYLIEKSSVVVGYVVVTFKFGMEYGGIVACIDDLFVKTKNRNQGLSTDALTKVREICIEKQVKAVFVEVGSDNGPALAVYNRIGMILQPGRQIYSVALAKPIHKL